MDEINNDEYVDGIMLHGYIEKFRVRAVETQEELIRATVNSFSGGNFTDITLDRQKTIEALTDYIKKPEQLPRINKCHILKMAIETNGEDAQVDMAIEEMSELIKALLKLRRAHRSAQAQNFDKLRADVIEEAADVTIMLKQLLIMFDTSNKAQEQVDYKIDRLGERLSQKSEYAPGSFEQVARSFEKI